MATKLYYDCALCGGAGERPCPDDENGLIFHRCKGCNGAGRKEYRLTVEQVGKIIAERDLLKAKED